MKRTYEEPRDDQRAKLHRRYEGSPLSTMGSPAWSASPNRQTTKITRHFKGCSKITDYEFLDKLGEGTFGYVSLFRTS